MSNSSGIKELRTSIVKFHEKVDGLKDISIDNVVVGPGSKQMAFLLLRVFDGGKLTRFSVTFI